MKRLLLGAVFCLVFSLTAVAENLLTNPSFNTPDANFENDDMVYQWAGTGWTQWGNAFRQRWATRSGHAGGYFRGWWDGTGGAGIYQDVAATGGIYTFTIWMRREPAFDLNLMDTKIEWLDADYNYLQTTFGTYSSVPADGLWHPIYVTSTFTNTTPATWVRAVLYGNWNNVGGSLAFDDAQLYRGIYTGATERIVNPSFEFFSTNDIRGTQWAASGDSYYPLENPWDVFDWAMRAGVRGLGFKGWVTNLPNYDVTVSQVITPGTGTFTFAAFLSREAGFLMTNAGLRIDVYDVTMTNLLQSAQTNFMVPANTNWYEYSVTLDVTNESAVEVRPAIFAQWVTNDDANAKALRIDDTRFFRGEYQPWEAEGLDYVYHNYTNAGWSTVEQVPGLGGAKFFDFGYSADERGCLHVLAPEGAVMGMRMRMYFADSIGETWWDGEWYTNVVIDSADPFHGYPAAGAVTMDVWRAVFYAPEGWQGNSWYAPAIRASSDGVEWWLAEELDDPAITDGVVATNNWPSDPQRFWSRLPYDHDGYFFGTSAIPQRLTVDWAYHNNTNLDSATEIIPSFDGTSTFFKIDYANTTTVFQLLAERPIRDLLPGERIEVLLRTSWWDPEDETWVSDFLQMSWVSNLVLDSAAPFHGLPAAGQHTVDLWRINWRQPVDNAGEAFTNAITVYYAPLLKVAYGASAIVGERYLLKQIEGATNGWGSNNYTVHPQLYGRDPTGDHDWFYINQRTVEPEYTDGVPNWWWELYFPGQPAEWVAGNDPDDDGSPNGDEFAADTRPDDQDSCFPKAGSGTEGGARVWDLEVPETTNSRLYDVWWRIDLLPEDAGWTPMGRNVTGTGGAIVFTVTNDVDLKFYRTGARVP